MTHITLCDLPEIVRVVRISLSARLMRTNDFECLGVFASCGLSFTYGYAASIRVALIGCIFQKCLMLLVLLLAACAHVDYE